MYKPGKLLRTVNIRTVVSKNYIISKVPQHYQTFIEALNVDSPNYKPADLIAHMGVKSHRFYKIINGTTDLLLCEAIAYFDYMKKRGYINEFSELFETLN